MASLERARLRYPEVPLKFKKDVDLADALHIANHARKTLRQK